MSLNTSFPRTVFYKHFATYKTDVSIIAWRKTAMFLLILFFFSERADAENFETEGHLKYRLWHGEDELLDNGYLESLPLHILDFRLKTAYQREYLKFIVHDEVFAISGFRSSDLAPGEGLLPLLQASASNDDDKRQIFDLTLQGKEGDDIVWVNRVDRLMFSYAKGRIVASVGRQAITWGNAILFPVLDFFNPFSPTQFDRDYKVGTDMLYSQWLLNDESDIQFVVVPRRDFQTQSIESKESSYVVKWRTNVDELSFDFLLSRHFDENLLGGGVSRDLWDGMFRLDVSSVELVNGDWKFSYVFNYDRSWVIFAKNLYGFVEYFYNGFGIDSGDYKAPPDFLISRLLRGEMFTIGRDYFGTGLRLELTPLLNAYANAFFNLGDESGQAWINLSYDCLENLQITASVGLPFGPLGSEFGKSPEGVGVSSSNIAVSGYFQLSYFFGVA